VIDTRRPFPIFLFLVMLGLDVGTLLVDKAASDHAQGEGVAWAVSVMSQAWVWAVLLMKAGQLFTWTAILARVDISLAFPLTSLSYPLAMLAAIAVFHETLSWQIWLGGLLITAGAILMGPGSGHGPDEERERAAAPTELPGVPLV
jgi:drug/metabolite transporter (DMT)-like permease